MLSLKENNQNVVKTALQAVKNEIFNSYDINATVGVGNSCGSTGQIGKSYLEASIAIDYKFILGEDKIIFFNEILICNPQNIIYPEKELKDIQSYIKQGNISCIEGSLAAIVKCIKENEMPIAIARCVCFDIINSVLKTVNEIGIFSSITKKEYFNVETLNNFNTIDELTDIIKRICYDLCSGIKQSKESHNFDLKDKLIRYVEENYNNNSFCVKAMSDDFGLSQSYLSRFFKDQTGQSISDYQLLLRIEKAKYYLKASDEPIKNIVDMIGYCNEASFVRLFKKAEGITPGEYRKLSQCRQCQ
jgi:AraC-like DNA-binding protein